MLIELTTPEAFQALIEGLEKHENLVWPDLKTEETYRDYFIRTTKEMMSCGIILLHVKWKYDPDTRTMICRASRVGRFECPTDAEYTEQIREKYEL